VKAPARHPEEARWVAHFDSTAEDWDSIYDESTVAGHSWRARLEAALRLIGDGPGSLLEIGFGSGRLLEACHERSWTVTGIDPSRRMVELARERVPSAATRLSAAKAEALPFADGDFDVAVAIGVLEYTDADRSLRELVRVLRPGGRAVIGLRNGRAPARVWQSAVIRPVAGAVKRIAPFGRPPAAPRRRTLSARATRELFTAAGLVVERMEHMACTVVPDPLDYVMPGLAYRAARRAERYARVRRVLGTQRLVLATKSW
jgi:ubiquinone/menaquinone biosynthesis C-methylase UbiE